jgi:hypothetical protein
MVLDSNYLGKQFEIAIARSWKQVPRAWRLRLRDGGSVERPADELVLLPSANLLNELKRTNKPKFSMKMLRTNQIKGLLEFEKAADRNYGLVFFNYFNEEIKQDRLFIFRYVHLLLYIKENNCKSLTFPLHLFEDTEILNLELECKDGLYDLMPLTDIRSIL